MKLSVSLPSDDVAALDEHIRKTGLRSRSAALHEAITLLRRSGLQEDYAAAWAEWAESGERDLWETASGDGVS